MATSCRLKWDFSVGELKEHTWIVQIKQDGADTKNIRIQERLARLTTLTIVEGTGLVIKIFLVENSRAVRQLEQKDSKNAPQCPRS
jgi:hypothetical protein